MFYDYPVLERQSRTLMEETAEFREERGELEKAQKEETRRTAVRKLLSRLKEDPEAYGQFLDLPPRLREELLDFYTGQRGVKITYDPFFKFVFNPELHPERLERMLSEIMKEKVKIRQVLSPESIRFHEGMSLVVMDILVELASGALCDVEIQKAPYAFPGQRAACYSSELVVRQYSRARHKAAAQNLPFSYRQLSKVYTIVILEKSSTIARRRIRTIGRRSTDRENADGNIADRGSAGRRTGERDIDYRRGWYIDSGNSCTGYLLHPGGRDGSGISDG